MVSKIVEIVDFFEKMKKNVIIFLSVDNKFD